MSTRATEPAPLVATVLAVVSVLLTVGAGATAGVLMARGDDPDGSGTLVRGGGESDPPSTKDLPPAHDYTGWQTITGPPGDSGFAASYRLPETEWKSPKPHQAVAYRDQSGNQTVSGRALANYYGNKCRSGGQRVPGAWAVLADLEPSGDLEEVAETAARGWAKGFGTNTDGTAATMSEPTTQSVTMPDGSTAGRSSITLDMSVFGDKCLPDEAEVMVTTIDTQDGAQSLVLARYLTTPGLSDETWRQISDSLEE